MIINFIPKRTFINHTIRTVISKPAPSKRVSLDFFSKEIFLKYSYIIINEYKCTHRQTTNDQTFFLFHDTLLGALKQDGELNFDEFDTNVISEYMRILEDCRYNYSENHQLLDYVKSALDFPDIFFFVLDLCQLIRIF